MGVGCSLRDESDDKPVISKTSVRQDAKKGDRPVLGNKVSTTSTKEDESRLKAEVPRKWIQPKPTPLPKGPQLITPDVSSFTVTNSTEECFPQETREARVGEPAEAGASGGNSNGGGGGAGFLGVGTIQSGHSSVASDALSATGFSTHSSNSMSISSSLSTNTALTPSGLHKWKLPPRLESLPDQMQRLLLGHPDSLVDLVSRPNVINLKIIAPEEEYMKERLLLWSDVIVPLRLVCAERGFALDVHDDLWARNTLTEHAISVLAAQEEEIEAVGEVLAGHIENQTDVVLLLLTPVFTPRLPQSLNHDDFTLILISLPDSDSTALLHSLYSHNSNLDPQRYELKVSEVTQHEEFKVKQLINFMLESVLAQGGDIRENLLKFRCGYRKAVEKVVNNKQLLINNTVALTPGIFSEGLAAGESRVNNTGTVELGVSVNGRASSSFRPRSPFVSPSQPALSPNVEILSSQTQKAQVDTHHVVLSSSSSSNAHQNLKPLLSGTASAAASELATATVKTCTMDGQLETVCDVGAVLSSIADHCSYDNIIQMLSHREPNTEPESDQRAEVKQLPCYLTSDICSRVKDAVSHLVETIIHQRQDNQRHVATGVPRSLIEELVTQTQHCRRLANPPVFMTPSPAPSTPSRSLLESPTINNIKEILTSDCEEPLIVYAPPGWGLSTLAAQLANFAAANFPTSLIIYRFMGISPDSQTLMSTLLSIRQQLDTILGPLASPERLVTESLSTETLLHDIAKRSTFHMPIYIILEGVTLHSRKLVELEVMTLTSTLPRTTKLVLLSSDADVIRGLRAKMKGAHYVKATPWEKEDIVELFTKSLQDRRQQLTERQLSVATCAIRSCPLPLYSSIVSHIALSWRSTDHVTEDDLPGSVEEILVRLLEPPKSPVPSDCFSAMMAYLTGAVGGLTPWEMGDLLSVNDTVLLSIYSDVRDPPIHRAPPIYWRVVRAALKDFLRVFVSAGFYTHTWASGAMRRCAQSRYLGSRTASTTLQRELADKFLGRWAGKKKPYPDPEEEIELLQDRFIMPQPDAFGSYPNTRRFMCLPTHLMLSGNKDSYAIDTCILNLPWLEGKIKANSVLQVLCDLEKAVAMETPLTDEIRLIQQATFNSSGVLNVNNREIYKCLQKSLKVLSKEVTSTNKGNKSKHRKSGLKQFFAGLSFPAGSFLYPMDEIKGAGTEKLYTSAIPLPAIDDIIPVTGTQNEIFMATLLRSEGEIKIVNIVTNKTVRTLTGADHPQRLAMLDSTTAVVLCNRELYVLDLDAGRVITKLRSVLNLRLPLFALQNSKHVVALSRDRMVAQVLDIQTGGIITSFKAGETRFLNSLLVSGDGRVLVCGDETQKPFPLLVWSLEQCKLLHDIRLPQHEFLTNMAAISYKGNCLACACREVDDHNSNFVVIYDLMSGHLFKKFKMLAKCVAVAIPPQSMTVLIGLDSGQLVVFDLVSGNQKFIIDGVQVSMTSIAATPSGKRCLTYSTDNLSISSHTVVLWDIEKGLLIASHTFGAGVTCAHLTPDGKMVALGIRGEYQPIRLMLVPEGSTLEQTTQIWAEEMLKDGGSKSNVAKAKTFGDPQRLDAIINLITD